MNHTIYHKNTTSCHTAFEIADDGTDFIHFGYLTALEN